MTEFTETEQEILTNAYFLAREGKGQVLEPFVYPEACRLADAGWLERRFEDNGDVSWWWTDHAETALDLNALTASVQGREN